MGRFKTDNPDFFFILVGKGSLDTKVFMSIEILSKKWQKQKFGTEYSTYIIDNGF